MLTMEHLSKRFIVWHMVAHILGKLQAPVILRRQQINQSSFIGLQIEMELVKGIIPAILKLLKITQVV